MAPYRSMSDEELTELLQSGDKGAFAEIYERYFNVLFLHALRRLDDRDACRDVIQELFCQLWSCRHKIVIKTNLAGYFYSSVRNKVLNCLAKRKYELKFMTTALNAEVISDNTTDHKIREKLLIQLIETEIQAMPPKMREVFELSRKCHYSHRQIAEQLNLTEQSVRSHVRGALRLLRAKLHVVLTFFKLF